MSALLKICGTGCDDGGVSGELVGLACGVLRNLTCVDEIKRFVVDQDAIPLCIKLVRSKNECSQLSATEFIQVMASWNDFVKGLIVHEGGICILVRVFEPKCLYSSKMMVVLVVDVCINGELQGFFNVKRGLSQETLYLRIRLPF